MQSRIIAIVGDRNCLFRCISYFLNSRHNHHREIHLQVVNHIVYDRENYKDFILGDMSYCTPIMLTLTNSYFQEMVNMLAMLNFNVSASYTQII